MDGNCGFYRKMDVVKDKKTVHTGGKNKQAVVVRSCREQNLVAALWGVVGLT